AYGALRDGVPKPETTACYETADVEARAEVVGVGRDGPVAACADLWRRGVLGSGGDVPPLTECVLDTGVAGVFPASPGGDVCTRLVVPSTAPPPASTTVPTADVNGRFLAFRDAVLARFVDVSCVEPQAAAETVRRELDRAGLRDWTIRAGQFTAERPCASLAFRPEDREIVLVAAPPRR
ncbi:MAG: hypothetical protein M3326_07800, partial [Actinomycetota bacterium]|nr:hypothetical protein [Actinomycetota bacterium]